MVSGEFTGKVFRVEDICILFLLPIARYLVNLGAVALDLVIGWVTKGVILLLCF